jgi:hypothetical protein
MHKFKNEIIDWLNGGKYECKIQGHEWQKIGHLQDFVCAAEVSKVDEYAHLKEALERGETIQLFAGGEWVDVEPDFSVSACNYRVKPKPKTKKMVQWLIKDSVGDYFVGHTFYEIGNIPQINYGTLIKPLPHTEIEVEE